MYLGHTACYLQKPNGSRVTTKSCGLYCSHEQVHFRLMTVMMKLSQHIYMKNSNCSSSSSRCLLTVCCTSQTLRLVQMSYTSTGHSQQLQMLASNVISDSGTLTYRSHNVNVFYARKKQHCVIICLACWSGISRHHISRHDDGLCCHVRLLTVNIF